MEKVIQCPFCQNERVEKVVMESGLSGYYCPRCGCMFTGQEEPLEVKPKEISKEQFFEIIFSAIKDIMKVDQLSDTLKEQFQSQFDTVEVYYEEIAQTYVEALYEIDCEEREQEIKEALFKEYE